MVGLSITGIVYVDMTLTRFKVKVMTLTQFKVKVMARLKFRKLCFSRSISSAVLSWSSKVMVDHDRMGPDLQFIGGQFLNFLSR